jgi:hypothetical protein
MINTNDQGPSMQKYNAFGEKLITERYENETSFDRQGIIDGKKLQGIGGSDGVYGPIILAFLIAPGHAFIVCLPISLILLYLEHLNPLSTLWGESNLFINLGAIFVIAWIVAAHFHLKRLVNDIAHTNARLYFSEGISAAFRQVYLANRDLSKEDFAWAFQNFLYGQALLDKQFSNGPDINKK